ncbi:MAG: ribosomal protein S18-alanine N-acetyltransferase [Gammaproteobacteria bacterium]
MSAVPAGATPRLRPMREHDLAQVVALEQRAYEFPWSLGIFADCLRVGYCCWTLELDDALAGYCIMSVAAEEAHVLNVCVAPEQRRQGHARRMLEHLVGIARGHRATVVFLEVRPSNPAAITLYLDFGFHQLAVRRNYYPAREGREDALVLALRLDEGAAAGG